MKIFVDVGACDGNTFPWLVKQPEFDGCAVFCFEPSPRHFHVLLQTAERLQSKYRITIFPFALGGGSGVVNWFQKVDNQADGLMLLKRWDGVEIPLLDVDYRIEVAMVNAAAFLFSRTNDTSRLTIKLDCEGSEFAILESIINHPQLIKRIDKVLVEWHPVPGNKEALIRRCAAAGLKLEEWFL